jgi:hypothetical protein
MASGAGEPVDRVAAVVDHEIITLSEVIAAYHLQEKKPAAPDREAMADVLDQLINRELAYQEIKRFEQIQADRGEVREAIEAYERTLAPEDYQAIIDVNGLTPEELEVIFSKKVVIEKFCLERFMPFIQVSPGEIDDYYHNVLLPEMRDQGETVPPGLEAASEGIRLRLKEDKFSQAVFEWIDRLMSRADIIILL